MHASQNIFNFLLPSKCLKIAMSKSGSFPVCIKQRQQEQQLIKPVMRTTMRVSSHPDYKAITGKIRMSPPIIPFTMQRIAMGPEICSPSSSILSYYNWFKIVSNHWNLEKKVSSDISSANLNNTLNHDGQAHTYHEGHCNQLTPSPFL